MTSSKSRFDPLFRRLRDCTPEDSSWPEEGNRKQNQTDEVVFAPHLVLGGAPQAVLARIDRFEGEDEVLADHTRRRSCAGHRHTVGAETKPRWLRRIVSKTRRVR